jgi:hypothetical protein
MGTSSAQVDRDLVNRKLESMDDRVLEELQSELQGEDAGFEEAKNIAASMGNRYRHSDSDFPLSPGEVEYVAGNEVSLSDYLERQDY